MKLIAACCGGLLMAMPAVDAAKEFYDYRTGEDFETQGSNCGELSAASPQRVGRGTYD